MTTSSSPTVNTGPTIAFGSRSPTTMPRAMHADKKADACTGSRSTVAGHGPSGPTMTAATAANASSAIRPHAKKATATDPSRALRPRGVVAASWVAPCCRSRPARMAAIPANRGHTRRHTLRALFRMFAPPGTNPLKSAVAAIANIVGSFVLALVVAELWAPSPLWARAGLGAGLLGSFTTFSALAVAAVHLIGADQWLPAVIYVAATLVLGLAAAAFGLRLGFARARRPDLVNE